MQFTLSVGPMSGQVFQADYLDCWRDHSFQQSQLFVYWSFIEKTCEARVNLAVCSYLADKPTLANSPLVN